MPFTTGTAAAGYELDRIRTHIPHSGNPDLALHADTSSAPGSKLCGFRNPSQVQHHITWSSGPPAVPFLAPDCAGQTLAASTTYWIVFRGTSYAPLATDADNEMTGGSGWTIGNVAAITANGGPWSNLSGGGTIPVEIWAR